jgi:hypothetical protein
MIGQLVMNSRLPKQIPPKENLPKMGANEAIQSANDEGA